MKNVYFTKSFESMLTLALENKEYGSLKHVYIDLTPEIKISDQAYTTTFADEIKKSYKDMEVIDIYPIIMRMRMVKSEEEVNELREAIKRTNLGINQLVMALREGRYEYELAVLFDLNGKIKGKKPRFPNHYRQWS